MAPASPGPLNARASSQPAMLAIATEMAAYTASVRVTDSLCAERKLLEAASWTTPLLGTYGLSIHGIEADGAAQKHTYDYEPGRCSELPIEPYAAKNEDEDCER